MPEIRIYQPGEDAGDVYAFRYRVYEQEMRRNDQYSDHKKHIIKDPLDAYSYNIAAYSKGEIVGVVRHTFCTDGDPGFYKGFFGLNEFSEDYPDRVSYTTRLMVSQSSRRSAATLMVCAECYNLSLAKDIIWSYCDCNDHLVGFFEKLFFEVCNSEKTHPSFGKVNIMRLDLRRPEIYDKKSSIIARFIQDADIHYRRCEAAHENTAKGLR